MPDNYGPDLKEVPNCKGSWALMTACGKCERCRDQAVEMVPGLLQINTKLEQKLIIVEAIITGAIRPGSSQGYKLASLEEAARAVAEK